MAYRPAPMPSPDVPVVDAQGKMTREWRNFFGNLTTQNLRDVSSAVATNGQVLVFNSTSGKYEPGSN